MTNMKVPIFRQAFSLVGIALLAGALVMAQQPGPPPGPPAGPAQPQAPLMAPNQLQTLVAPIALYPDALLSQVLVAATYPLEIAEAAQWMQQHRDLQGAQVVDAARQMNWDPSIQALVVFPDVLSRLAADIRWTTDLGNAFLAQQNDVMNAVQAMRQQAMASGKLRSNPQETVTTEMDGGQPAIDIAPANPEVVYVPYYDPASIWGPPVYGYYPAWDYAGFGFGFFPGIYIGGFFGGLGWGGWGWGLNWFHGGIFQRPFFFNHYGFAGFHGGAALGRGTVAWAHDATHRMGVAYPNRALSSRYGAASNARAGVAGSRGFGQSYGATQHSSPAGRTSSAQAGGWNRFGQSGSGYRSSPSYGGSNAYRSSPSYGNSNGAGRAAPSYHPNYGSGYGGARTAPGYRAAPSSGGGRSYGSARPSGGSRSGGGGSVHSSGGGSVRSSGGGGGGHSSGGGGSHGGGGGGGHHR